MTTAEKVAAAVAAADELAGREIEAAEADSAAGYESDKDVVIKKRAEQGLSNTMKNKLKQELKSQGADPNTAFNPYPIIFIGMSLAVIVAGAGILFW